AGGERVLSVSQLLPVPDAEDFMIKPRSSASTQAEARTRRERRATIAASPADESAGTPCRRALVDVLGDAAPGAQQDLALLDA
ncbi:MAG TPA: hypothetical protein VFB74_20020, partial [Kribbellaceae bacterium]|nr:hypothetical protein [Kribbellaceae bacterium]